MNAFSERLKARRKTVGLSVEGLSERINVSVSVLYKYERGEAEPSLETLALISDHLSCTTDYLLGQTQVSFDNPKARKASELVDKLPLEMQDLALIVLNGIAIQTSSLNVQTVLEESTKKKLSGVAISVTR